MTIEEKAKAYDEALERAKKNYITAQDLCEDAQIDVGCFKNTIESIFPELKKEKTKRILYSISSKISFHLHDIFTEEEFQCFDTWSNDWLEKQVSIDKNEVANCVLNEVANSIMRWLDSNCAEGNICLSGMECEDIENAIRNANWQKIYGYMKKKLEKQSEQKTQAKSAIEIWKDMRLEVYQQASGNRHEANYSDDTTKMFSLNDIDEIIEKISEQKSADKVEPKFKVGDWITIKE